MPVRTTFQRTRRLQVVVWLNLFWFNCDLVSFVLIIFHISGQCKISIRRKDNLIRQQICYSRSWKRCMDNNHTVSVVNKVNLFFFRRTMKGLISSEFRYLCRIFHWTEADFPIKVFSFSITVQYYFWWAKHITVYWPANPCWFRNVMLVYLKFMLNTCVS